MLCIISLFIKKMSARIREVFFFKKVHIYVYMDDSIEQSNLEAREVCVYVVFQS